MLPPAAAPVAWAGQGCTVSWVSVQAGWESHVSVRAGGSAPGCPESG